jgi:hypothetical protein
MEAHAAKRREALPARLARDHPRLPERFLHWPLRCNLVLMQPRENPAVRQEPEVNVVTAAFVERKADRLENRVADALDCGSRACRPRSEPVLFAADEGTPVGTGFPATFSRRFCENSQAKRPLALWFRCHAQCDLFHFLPGNCSRTSRVNSS